MAQSNNYSYWQTRFQEEVLKSPGNHLLLQGYTGAGKTNTLFWILAGFLHLRESLPSKEWETLVWFDRGKSSEILQLAIMAPVRLLIPEGCDVELHLFDDDNTLDIEKIHFSSAAEVWKLLDADRINIICLQRFLLDPFKMAPVTSTLFKSLITESFNYAIHPKNTAPGLLLPRITIIIDEINNIAPSKGQGAGSRDEATAGAWIQQNIEQLRSQHIRLIGSVHGWRKVRPGVRSSFPCHIALPGASFPSSEKPKLSRFNAVFEKLGTGECCLIFQKDIFSPPFKIPYYGKGEEFGYLMYKGQLKTKTKTPPADPPKIDKQFYSKEDIIKIVGALN